MQSTKVAMHSSAVAAPEQVGVLCDKVFSMNHVKTPFLTLSIEQVASNFKKLKAALPRVQIHYAVKPNNHQAIIKEIYRQRGNFDVCSLGEIKQVLKTGIEPASLVHSHPIKSTDEFDGAVEAGLETFVVDNFEEVKKLSRYTDKKLKVLVRFRINTDANAVCNLQYKYGCTTREVLPLAEQIREIGHEYYGLCFHIGSQCIYAENYVKAIRTAHRLINKLESNGLKTRMLDIGGGFPIDYLEQVPAIEELCKPINAALEKQIRPDIKIICEPGRYIVGNACTLATTVIGKAAREDKIWYYLDDGLYSTFSGQLYDHCNYPILTERTGRHRLSVLAGPTCDSFDVMYDGVMIPEHEVNDRIFFGATGAYCSVSGSNFNALKRPEYILID
ncbi:MAG TPA: type III PLP-dependent enzyme [candidate division Zixibacteria bacterium]|nr:type III PLP-dependent enzyme [candidate division Zixibacteria bacterium]